MFCQPYISLLMLSCIHSIGPTRNIKAAKTGRHVQRSKLLAQVKQGIFHN